MRTVDLELLRSLVLVVECGGFSSAQKRVHLTQSTISQQIKRLESHLGAPLLLRSKSGVTPTEAGERVLSYARRMLALEAEMNAVVSQQRSVVTLRVGFTDDFAQLHLHELLNRVRALLPQVALRVTCDLSAHLRKGLAGGELDVVFYKRMGGTGPGARIAREPVEWVAARGYTRNASEPLPLLLFPSGCVYRQRALARLEASALAYTVVFESPSTLSVQAAVRAGLGIALLTPGSTPEGCCAIGSGLPALGQTELVCEYGSEPSPEAEQLLQAVRELLDTRARNGTRRSRLAGRGIR
jgi:DNA-binding transcriptional LysR family regulator